MKVLIKSAWGSDDPTKACFAFLHANAFAEAGHEVRIFLLGEAVNLMKDELISAVTPVGWPPPFEIMTPRSWWPHMAGTRVTLAPKAAKLFKGVENVKGRWRGGHILGASEIRYEAA
jgi:peroxiredoxin family protein